MARARSSKIGVVSRRSKKWDSHETADARDAIMHVLMRRKPDENHMNPVVRLFLNEVANVRYIRTKYFNDQGKLLRPPNQWMIFRSMFYAWGERHRMTLYAGALRDAWHTLSEEEMESWVARAREARDDHMRRFPHYVFSPKKKQFVDGMDVDDEEDGEIEVFGWPALVQTGQESEVEVVEPAVNQWVLPPRARSPGAAEDEYESDDDSDCDGESDAMSASTLSEPVLATPPPVQQPKAVRYRADLPWNNLRAVMDLLEDFQLPSDLPTSTTTIDYDEDSPTLGDLDFADTPVQSTHDPLSYPVYDAAYLTSSFADCAASGNAAQFPLAAKPEPSPLVLYGMNSEDPMTRYAYEVAVLPVVSNTQGIIPCELSSMDIPEAIGDNALLPGLIASGYFKRAWERDMEWEEDESVAVFKEELSIAPNATTLARGRARGRRA